MNGIIKRRLDPDEARTHFSSNDAEDGAGRQFGRVTSKRKSYRSSSRRARANDAEIIETEELSEQDDEGFESKLARLRREIAEVQAESERRKAQDQGIPENELQVDVDDLDSLGRVLDEIGTSNHEGGSAAATRLIQKINVVPESRSSSTNGATGAVRTPQPDVAYTLNYAPTYSRDHTLARIADFDRRLTLLETILGADTIPLATQDRPDVKPILPTMESLQRQISVVSDSSDSSLDTTNRRVKQLTQDAEKLTEARKSAKAAMEALSDYESEYSGHNEAKDERGAQSIENPEQISKINALYGALPTIESLSPLLPSLLDRLRSLRLVHADAANASESLAKAESRQQVMADELRSWREGLEKVETVLKQSEQTLSGNMSTVEGWVRELEERMEELVH